MAASPGQQLAGSRRRDPGRHREPDRPGARAGSDRGRGRQAACNRRGRRDVRDRGRRSRGAGCRAGLPSMRPSTCGRGTAGLLTQGYPGELRLPAGRSSGPRVQARIPEQLGAVGQHEERASASRRGQVRHERPGGGLVEVLGRLVEDQQADVGQERAGKGQALALAAGQARPVLPDRGLEAGRERAHPVEEAGRREGRLERRGAGAGPGEPEVVGERAVEDVGVLLAQADGPPDVVTVEGPDVGGTRSSRPAPGCRPPGPGTGGSAAASVLLPAPLGPVTTTRAPAGTSSVERREGVPGRARVAHGEALGAQPERTARGRARVPTGPAPDPAGPGCPRPAPPRR